MSEDTDGGFDTQAPVVEVPEDICLTDSSAESLSRTFKQIVTQQRVRMEGFKPTLEDLNEIVAKFHDTGIDTVGVELVDFNRLREFNLLKRTPADVVSDEKPLDIKVLYCILNIYDAKFLVRVHQDHVIDCYLDNINKPSAKIQYLDSPGFWHKKDGTKKIERFFRCDLQQEIGRVELMNTILQTAATCAVAKEMADICLPDKKVNGFSKPSGGFVIR